MARGGGGGGGVSDVPLSCRCPYSRHRSVRPLIRLGTSIAFADFSASDVSLDLEMSVPTGIPRAKYPYLIDTKLSLSSKSLSQFGIDRPQRVKLYEQCLYKMCLCLRMQRLCSSFYRITVDPH